MTIAMAPRTKSVPWLLGVGVALVGGTVWLARGIVVHLGLGSAVASFFAAAIVGVSLGLYGECYKRWARVFWGAPFQVGDRVRIVRGLGGGAEAIVVALGQGVEVEVEFDNRGLRLRRRLLWGSLRRIGPARPFRSPVQEPVTASRTPGGRQHPDRLES